MRPSSGSQAAARPSSASGGRPATASGGRPQAAKEGFTVRVRTDKATLRCVLESPLGQTDVQGHGQHRLHRVQRHMPSISSLRDAIAAQSQIGVSWQRLTRERRHWFDEDAQSAAAAADDFPDAAATLLSCGIQHGDMLFVSARPAITAVHSDVTELAPTEDDAAAETELMRAHPAAEVQGSPLAFRGWDLADEAEAKPAVPSASQAAASSLLQTVRQTLREQSAIGSTHGVDEQLDELSRLISLCGPGANSSSFWSSVASSNSTAASSTPVPSLSGGLFGATSGPHASAAGDLADGATHSEPTSASTEVSFTLFSSARDRSSSSTLRSRPQSQSQLRSHSTDLDGLTTARPDERGHAASADAPSDASSAALADSPSQVNYWRDRYTRLRVKAEKMNAAGLSLRNQMDVAALAHEKQQLLLRGRIERRDAKIAQHERTLRAWERADLARGGDGRVHVEDAETTTRASRQAQLTSLAAAPAVTARATSAHHPTPPRSSSRTRGADPHSGDSGVVVDSYAEHGAARGISPTPSVSGGAPVVARRVRPESASRVRPSRPSSGSAPVRAMPGVGVGVGVGVAGSTTGAIADGTLSHAPSADEFDATRTAAAAAPLRSNAAAPLVRPASAGRSRRASGVGSPLGAPSGNSASDVSATADWSSSPVGPLSLGHSERDAAALHAAAHASLIHSSRSQVRQVVEAAKLARSAHAIRGTNAL